MTLPLAIYCKSFINDIERARLLFRSIEQYSEDDIPLVVSVPKADKKAFKKILPGRAILLPDHKVVDRVANPEMGGWRDQQVLKLAFSETGIAETYVVVDSDTFFLRPFNRATFIHPDGRPYLVASPLFARYRIDKNPQFIDILNGTPPPTLPSLAVRTIGGWHTGGYDRTRLWTAPSDAQPMIANLLGVEETGRFTYMPPPVVIHSPFLDDLRRRYMEPNGLTWRDLIAIAPWEFVWYALWALREHAAELHPRHPYFALFGTDAEIQHALDAGVTVEKIIRNFHGVALGGVRHQSKIAFWPADLIA